MTKKHKQPADINTDLLQEQITKLEEKALDKLDKGKYSVAERLQRDANKKWKLLKFLEDTKHGRIAKS